MTAFAYVGNAEDAAGFRLAGVRCWAPRDDARAALRAALASGVEVVFVTTDMAQTLPRAELDAALAAGHPLLVLVPEPDGEASPLDPAQRVRAQLGLEQ
jgi:vacuolar-type H+-ATPase subunit F/Vma7